MIYYYKMRKLRISPKIQLKRTNKSGNGFHCKIPIHKDQQLMKISNENFISCCHYSQFSQFSQLRNCDQIDKKTLFAYFLAAVHVTHNKLQEFENIYQYFQILPKNVNGLVCWSDQELDKIVNSDLVKHIKEKKSKILAEYNHIQQEVHRVWSNKTQNWEYRLFLNKSQPSQITLALLIYYISIIESRVVYYSCQQDSKSDVGALAPYLQLFNHSKQPTCTVESGNYYTVLANRDIQVGEQIYVSYGHYSREKFIEMYGFLQDGESIQQNQEYRDKLAKMYNKLYQAQINEKMENSGCEQVTNVEI